MYLFILLQIANHEEPENIFGVSILNLQFQVRVQYIFWRKNSETGSILHTKFKRQWKVLIKETLDGLA